MEKQIIAYSYRQSKAERVIGLLASAIIMGLVIYLLVQTGKNDMEKRIAIFGIVFFGLGFVLNLINIFRKPVKSQQLLTKDFSFRLYQKNKKGLFVLFSGGMFGLLITAIAGMCAAIYKGGDSLLQNWISLTAAFVVVTLLAGTYRLKRIGYILRTGLPVYNSYNEVQKTDIK